MKRCMLGLAVVGLVAAAGSANAAISVNENFSLSGGVGTYSKTSTDALDLSPGVAYSILINTASISGMALGQPQNMSLTNPTFGNLTALTMIGAGETGAIAPMTLWSRNYVFTEAGQSLPAYDFTVTLDLLADRRVRTTLTVNALNGYQGPFPPLSAVTANSLSITGSMGAVISTVPAPSAALPLAGAGLLTMRRRRR